MTGRLLIVGYGNPLMGDDGAGPTVASRLCAAGVPDGVRVEKGETDSLTLRDYWQGEPEIWLVDALWSSQPPGSVCDVGHEELLSIPQRHVTAHQLSLPESLHWLQLVYPEMAKIRFRLWGITAARVELGRGLSREVSLGVDVAVDCIMQAAMARSPQRV